MAQPSASVPVTSIETAGKGLEWLVKEIENLGVCEVSPPGFIVVVGDQSVGKTSLIETIAGIRVPRISSTFRFPCPLKVTLTTGDDWHGTIEIHRQYTYCPEDPDHPLYPWRRDHSATITPFGNLENKEQVPTFLLQAQDAILSLGEENPTNNRVPLSPNVICLNITAPKLPNLSFYDLPGVIEQTENESDMYLVELVKALVQQYITQENALVLVAMSLESSICNSTAAQLVRKAHVEHRSLGVLTKSDRLPADSSLQLIEDILAGQKFSLGHGYWVTRQLPRSDLDNGLQQVDARRQECIFFQSEPWSGTHGKYQGRFGIENLQRALSEMIAIQTRTCLLSIRQRVDDRLREIKDQLALYDQLRHVQKYLDDLSKKYLNATVEDGK